MSSKSHKAGGLASLRSTLNEVLRSQRAKDNFKNLMRVNKDGGFDCPGCAWGDSKDGAFQFCENGAKAVAWESTARTVDRSFFAEHSVTQLMKQMDHWLEFQGRLTEPMRYNQQTDHYEAISWADAFALIATHLNALESPNEAEFYTSGRASNEASFLYQLFGRAFGTNNFPDCSNMCHEASGLALNQSIGVGKGTVVLSDFEQADTIFVYGQNPGTNHPRMMNALKKAAKRGCTIVAINNLKEVALNRFASPQDPVELLTPAATQISSLYITPKLGGDMAFVRGMVKALVEAETAFNQEFIDRHTIDSAAYLSRVAQTSWQAIEQQSGVSKSDIEQAAQLFAKSKQAISTWAMGLTQHKHSVDTIRELVNLHLLFGQIGRPGAGLCPVRGHSNVQGNRTMGINEKPPAAFLDALKHRLGFEPPTEHGHNVNQALQALHQGQAKVLVCLGGNLAAAAPDTEFTYRAIANAKLNVQISTKLNRSHLLVGQDALILPCLGRTEIDQTSKGLQQITVEDTFSMVHASAGGNEPVGADCLSETRIVAEIAAATLKSKPINWLDYAQDYSLIRALIADVLPAFADFNDKIKQQGGFHLANSAALLQWNTCSGKAQFHAVDLPADMFPQSLSAQLATSEQPTLTLQTLRSHDQYNTTIYGMNDRYRGIKNQRHVLFMNASDAEQQGLSEGDWVQISSLWPDQTQRQVDGFQVVFYDIPKGNAAAYYPETNPLVPIDSYGDLSFTPTSKSIAIQIAKSTSKIPLATA
ncbi:FdhF/YdeP family oxidoreductase [Neiella sp. HB171785]|uniref:FdhF/YdeP family oxidoreductase n=1 Tax=Neiella litorisoli TaxID=2771431 RepID=A0A8J6QH45_9GAMM|nr:FdhF/YdeP family oxidoreductase [Neiella litorisoli]MBD1388362.1 FdhF/YdeP family oxidoreductase [Neiella litorisoli]